MMVKMEKIFYHENNETHIATGEVIAEDSNFITVIDRYEGKIKIGKSFIIKIKDVIDDGNKEQYNN